MEGFSFYHSVIQMVAGNHIIRWVFKKERILYQSQRQCSCLIPVFIHYAQLYVKAMEIFVMGLHLLIWILCLCIILCQKSIDDYDFSTRSKFWIQLHGVVVVVGILIKTIHFQIDTILCLENNRWLDSTNCWSDTSQINH